MKPVCIICCVVTNSPRRRPAAALYGTVWYHTIPIRSQHCISFDNKDTTFARTLSTTLLVRYRETKRELNKNGNNRVGSIEGNHDNRFYI